MFSQGSSKDLSLSIESSFKSAHFVASSAGHEAIQPIQSIYRLYLPGRLRHAGLLYKDPMLVLTLAEPLSSIPFIPCPEHGTGDTRLGMAGRADMRRNPPLHSLDGETVPRQRGWVLRQFFGESKSPDDDGTQPCISSGSV